MKGVACEKRAEVVDSECICSDNVPVQSVYLRPTAPSAGHPHYLQIIASVPVTDPSGLAVARLAFATPS